MPFPVTPDIPLEGQESVWAYPRPAIAQACARHIRIEHGGEVVAETRRSVRTLETSHPPSYYIPPDDVRMELLRPNGRRTLCEWKGQAVYFDLSVGGGRVGAVAWAYPAPTPPFASLKGHLAFYPSLLDACFVDGERVVPQPGEFYGGWVTSHVAGPFKGIQGSRFW